jgi:TetR/AcrR family transcriptional regulator, cholesterol catabolism regulator
MSDRGARASSRDAILREFAEQVADRGYAETSISDVATALHLSKGTIVHHFGSKEHLLGEVHVAYFTRRFAEADFIRAELSDPMSRLVSMVYALLAAHRDDRAASLTCLREFVRYLESDVLATYVREQRERYMGLVVETINDGVDQGVFHTSDPVLASLQLFGMCNYAWTWYRPDGRRSVEDIARVFAEDLLGGLATKRDEQEELDEIVATAIDVVRRAPARLPPQLPPASGGRT